MELMKHQKDAVRNLTNGSVLYGGVGSGKSFTAMAYYAEKEMPRDVYIITTAKKRDKLEWNKEAAHFAIGTTLEASVGGILTVDSWNNISAYVGITDAFFIFDEQRVVGTGAWVKSFLKIARNNHWILLSATPGDTWTDYAPIFIANGWYKNITDFRYQHCVYAPRVKYPKIIRYINTDKLEKLRNEVLVEMPYIKHTNRIMNWMDVGYNKDLMAKVVKDRWHVFEDRPLIDVAEMFRVIRKLDGTDPSRIDMVHQIMQSHDKLIIFYKFNYELEILRGLKDCRDVAEWNGHKKQPIPDTDKWVYLVQYTSGAEGWNCVETDAMLFYSLTYSYKNFHQSQGRIDRLDTPFTDLYYYILVSNSLADVAQRRSLGEKRNFQERNWVAEHPEYDDLVA